MPGADNPSLEDDLTCDLAIVGGGFTGLWSALKARERWPDKNIVVLEADRCGNAASGRNGGFCAPSISHGAANAVARWPKEAETLVRLGHENLDGFQQDITDFGIDAEFERAGKLNVAATPWQVQGLKATQEVFARFGYDTQILQGADLHDKLNSPVYDTGLFEPNYALINPGKLVAGLRENCIDKGVELYEHSPVTALPKQGASIRLATDKARISARQIILATNAAVPLLKRLRAAIIPVFDYALVTEPLNADQLAAIGWEGRHGVADSGNQFHYSRKTADNRILWGGYDAIYHYGSDRDVALQDRPETFNRLAGTFRAALPALDGVQFSHAWGGIIDTSARTTFFVNTALDGQLAYAMGFTGQGVTASRFAALAMLDMLEGKQTERTTLSMIRRRPVPFPPEPLRSLAIRRAQRDLAWEDQTGNRSFYLRCLDRLGIGFDS